VAGSTSVIGVTDFRGRDFSIGDVSVATTIGIQFSNSQIGTVVQGIDAAAVAKISEALVVAQRGNDPHRRTIDTHPIFQSALMKAEQMCEAGHIEAASRSFLDALEEEERDERERQEDRKLLRLRLLEEGVVYDKRVPNPEAAFAKLQLIAALRHPANPNAQAKYLEDRASDYQSQGTVKGDIFALQIAVAVFKWLAKGAVNVER
jgi:hypothetical protein